LEPRQPRLRSRLRRPIPAFQPFRPSAPSDAEIERLCFRPPAKRLLFRSADRSWREESPLQPHPGNSDSQTAMAGATLRFAHEMNDPYRYPWGPQNNSKEEYIYAWQHVWQRFQKAGARNVIWTWS